ncbi:MAG: DUF1080 domain-containing protein [Verrucomicrobiota bacterium]
MMTKNLWLTVAFVFASLSASAESEFVDLLASGDLSEFYTGDKEGRWTYVDGVATRGEEHAGSLVTKKKYKDFELVFEWKIAEGGNSGVIYRCSPWPGIEYQVLDDERHVRGKVASSSAGALYDILEPIENKPYKPAGEWNTGRIVADGDHIEHWLNGIKILEIDIGSEEWNKRFAASKYSKHENSKKPEHLRSPAPIQFQDHQSPVWYRNIKIREL